MKIPCKDCLILPLCRHKPVITCSWLFDYFMSTNEAERYDKIRKILGNGYRFMKGGRTVPARKIYNEKGENMWI